MLLFFSLVGLISVNAFEEEQKKIRFGNSICSWRGSKIVCKSMESAHEESDQKKEGVRILSGSMTVQIDTEGKLTICDDTSDGDEGEGHVVVRDLSGGITFDTKKKNETDATSIDDEETQLKPGSSITFASCFGASQGMTVIYDKIIKLISKKDESEHDVLNSPWNASQEVSVATRNYGGERNGASEVLLDETGGEIQLLNSFLEFDEEKRKTLLAKLPIDGQVKFLVNLHKHGCIKEFGCNYFDYGKQLLEKRVGDSLKQVTSKDMSCWPAEIKWLKEGSEWNCQEKEIIESVIRKIMRPVSKVLFQGDNIEWIDLNVVGTRAVITYKDGRKEVIEFDGKNENRKVLFQRYNIKSIAINADGTRATITYKNGRGEVREFDGENKNGKVLFQEDNIKSIAINADGKRATIRYKDGRGEVIEFDGKNKKGKVLFQRDNIRFIYFNADCTRFVITYKDGRRELREFDGENKKGKVLFQGDNIKCIYFNADCTRFAITYKNDRGEVREFDGENENRKVLFQGDNIEFINLNSVGTKATIIYKDGKGEVREFDGKNENRKVLFQGDNIEWISLNADGTRAIIEYKDGRGEVREFDGENKKGKILFQGDNITWFCSNADGTRTAIVYRGDRGKILDLEDYDRGIIFTKLKPEELLFLFCLKNWDFTDSGNLMRFSDLCAQLSDDLKQKFFESYMPKKFESSLLKEVDECFVIEKWEELELPVRKKQELLVRAKRKKVAALAAGLFTFLIAGKIAWKYIK